MDYIKELDRPFTDSNDNYKNNEIQIEYDNMIDYTQDDLKEINFISQVGARFRYIGSIAYKQTKNKNKKKGDKHKKVFR